MRLSLAFLGTWFHWMLHLPPPQQSENDVDEDADIFRDAALTKLSELARAIAVWPAGGETVRRWESIVREIAALIAEEAQSRDARTSDPDVLLSTPCLDEVEADFPVSTMPIILDPRNYLPTPPPTPPPFAISRVPSIAERAMPALSPHFGDNVDRIDIDHTEQKADTSDVPRRDVGIQSPLPLLPQIHSSPATAEDAVEAAPEAVVVPPPSASPQLHPRSTMSPETTATCLLAGYLFGALIVIVFSQRRSGLLYVS